MRAPKRDNELATLLRRLADYVEHQSDLELTALMEDSAKLLAAAERQTKKRPTPYKGTSVTGDLYHVVNALQNLSSREDGENLLREKTFNRNKLETLARYLQLPVQRDDTIEKLRDKIIERTIGSRLRSNAIRGPSLLPE